MPEIDSPLSKPVSAPARPPRAEEIFATESMKCSPTSTISPDPLCVVLEILQGKAMANEPFADDAKKLSALLRERSDAPAVLLEMIRTRERHARVRWLAIEELGKLRPPPALFISTLVDGLSAWRDETDALALIGAAV